MGFHALSGYVDRLFCRAFPVTDILDYCSLIHICRTDKIAFVPEMTIPKLILKIRELLEYHQTAFSFQVAHDLGNTILGRNFDTHMYMINTCIHFQYLNPFIFAQFS